MDSGEVARTLLDAAWISARIAAAFAALLAVASIAVVAARESHSGHGAPRVRRPGAGPRMAAQLAALLVGAAVTAWTPGQAQAWLPPPAQAVLATLAALGVLFAATFVAWSAWTLGPGLVPGAVVGERATLVTSGPFALVRHPFYAAWGLLGAGAALAFGSLAGVAVFLATWIPATRWRAALEEEALAEAWGDDWSRYVERTPRFLPKW